MAPDDHSASTAEATMAAETRQQPDTHRAAITNAAM
jgi:hypothetical protein